MTATDSDVSLGMLGSWSVPRTTKQVPVVRRQVWRLAKAVRGDAEWAHEVAMCAAETIGNAVRHGSGDQISVIVCADEDGLTVEVCDGGSDSIPKQQAGADESGRGLLIVSQLADRWGHHVDPETGQRCVFFEFDLTAASESGGAP